MPQRKAATKSLKQSKVHQLRNKKVKTRLHTEQRKLERIIERGDAAEAAKQLALLTKLLHQAAAKDVIHPHRAAHQQARWQKRISAL